MSWSGTCRCSYCYNEGHNRRACPDRISDEDATIKDLPDSIAAQRIRSRRRHNKSAQKLRAQNRSCSYCQNRGHNRRTCPIKREDTLRIQDRSTEYRRAFAENMKQRGVGVGALVRLPDPQRFWKSMEPAQDASLVGIITKVSWDSVNISYHDVDLEYTGFHSMDRGEHYLVEVRVVSCNHDSKYGASVGDTVPVKSHLFMKVFPDLFQASTTGRDLELKTCVEILGSASDIKIPGWFFSADTSPSVLRRYRIDVSGANPGRHKHRLDHTHESIKVLYPEIEEERRSSGSI
jgi:hypothetical protein